MTLPTFLCWKAGLLPEDVLHDLPDPRLPQPVVDLDVLALAQVGVLVLEVPQWHFRV